MVTAATEQSHPRPPAFDGEVDLDRDRRLVQSAQAGDKEAFDVLYACYFTRLERYCFRRLRDPHEAQDAAQEAFLRAWRALPSFGGDRRFYPWLSVIASNLCTDSLRRKQRFGPIPVAEFQGQEASTGASAEESAAALEELDLAARAFGRLSDRHRRVLYLREQSGLSYQAIADQEGLRVTTVETLIWRARKALRREFTALSGSEGLLGGGAVAGAAWSHALRRFVKKQFVKKLGTLSTRVASTGPKGICATLGGAVATAAIVVASYGGATHAPSARISALPEGPKSASVVPGASLEQPASVTTSGPNRKSASPSTTASPSTGTLPESSTTVGSTPSAPSAAGRVASPPTTSGARPGGSETKNPGGSNGLGNVGSALQNTEQGVIDDIGSLLGNVDSTLGSANRLVRRVTRNLDGPLGSATGAVKQAAGSVDGELSKTIASTLGSLDNSGADHSGADHSGSPGLLGGLLG